MEALGKQVSGCLAIVLLLVGAINTAKAGEIMRDRHNETFDFSLGKAECDDSRGEIYFRLSVADVTLWANQGLPIPERECYQLKWQLEDYLRTHPKHDVQVVEVEITGEVCDGSRHCLPDESSFQSRASVDIGGLVFGGYKKRKVTPRPVSPPPGRHSNCEYHGRLDGGWWCP